MEETVEVPPPGKRIGPYTVERELGRGAMGVVYLAEDPTLRRKVALKVLSDEAGAERFLREARAAAKITHQHVVQVYAAEMDAHQAYIAMEYVEGETLAEVIRREGGLDWKTALGGTRQIAYALDAAHAEGIIHRDLKPSNVIVSGENLKVADFGLAAVPEDWGKLTSDGTFLGTPLYASPEQCEGDELDGRSDVYSLGVILFEALTGKTPFEAPTPAALFRRISTEEPPDLGKLAPELPPVVVDLVGRMLARRKEERIATALQIAEEIRHILGSTPARRKRSAWPVYLGIAAGLFLLGGAVCLRLTKARTPMLPGVQSDPGLPIVAVAPFENRTADAELGWLGAGLADFVATDLSAARGLRVSRKEAVPPGGYRLSGGFVRVGKMLRIDAQLTDPQSGEILFARKVEGDAGGLFALVDTLCERLLVSASERFGAQALEASELRLEGRLFPEVQKKAMRPPPGAASADREAPEGLPEEAPRRRARKAERPFTDAKAAAPALEEEAKVDKPRLLRGALVAKARAAGPRLRAVQLYYKAQDLRRLGREEEARRLLDEARKLRTGFRKLEK